MKIENLIAAATKYGEIDVVSRAAGIISHEHMAELKKSLHMNGVTYEQAEVFSDVMLTKDLNVKLRESMLDVFSNALLALAEEYDFDNKMAKSVVASCLMDVIE